MGKKALLDEYEKNGLSIIDFHLGRRTALQVLGVVSKIFSFVMFLIILPAFLFEPNALEVGYIIPQGILAFLLLFRPIPLIFGIVLSQIGIVMGIYIWFPNIIGNSEWLITGQIDYLIFFWLPFVLYELAVVLVIVLAIRAYQVNKNIIMKDGILSIPATDVEMGIFQYITLKPIRGVLHKLDIPINKIVQIKIDGYGNKKKGIYPVSVVDTVKSNRLIFTSRQKRDEFRTKLGLLIGQSTSGFDAFGESA